MVHEPEMKKKYDDLVCLTFNEINKCVCICDTQTCQWTLVATRKDTMQRGNSNTFCIYFLRRSSKTLFLKVHLHRHLYLTPGDM